MKPEHNLNLIGLAMRDGVPTVQALTDDDADFFQSLKQSPIYGERWLSYAPPRENAATILDIFNRSYHDATGLVALTWALGTHLKAYTGFYPHLNLHGAKCSGKTALLEGIASTQAIFRLSAYQYSSESDMRRIRYGASFGVALDEVSLRGGKGYKERLQTALHTGYHYMHLHRGGLDYTQASPLALVTQDPLPFARNKIISLEMRSENNAAPLEYNEVPIFPVREWLDTLAATDPQQAAKELMQTAKEIRDQYPGLSENTSQNYAMLAFAWRLLTDFGNYKEHSAIHKFSDWMIAQLDAAVQEAA